jgi:hypothetical protein
MTNCLVESDFQQLADEALSGFDERVAAIPADLCGPFYEEARRLETELLSIYRVFALLARKEDALDKIASLWGTMVAHCDQFAQKLSGLSQSHPNCGADFFYDRVLDLRNKCRRLQEMHS